MDKTGTADILLILSKFPPLRKEPGLISNGSNISTMLPL